MKLVLLMGAALFCGSALSAGVVTPDGVWQTMNNPGVSGEKLTGVVNSDGNASAYWNQNTADSTKCANIGCFITRQGFYTSGTAGYAKSPNADNAVWLGKDNGTSSLDFSFEGGTGTNGLSLLIEIAGFRTTNWMGWYDAEFKGQFTSANRGTAWDVVFDGNDAPDNVTGSGTTTSFGTSVASAVISPTPSFGFWFLSNHSAYDMNATNIQNAANRLNGVDSRGAMFTQSDRNRTFDKTNQYFSLFAESEAALAENPAKYWVGVEDLRNGDWDYNDMVFSFSLISPVPEPGFYGAVAIGLAGLYWLRSRRRA